MDIGNSSIFLYKPRPHHHLPHIMDQPQTKRPKHKTEFYYAFSFLILLISSIVLVHFATPFDTQTLLRLEFWSRTLQNNQEPYIKQACDYTFGKWVLDEKHHLPSYTENCRFLDPGFRCHQNGRKNMDHVKWRWQPNHCNLPRFNASDILERSRNGRIVFVGDSIGRNQWESFLCMLTQAVSNQSTMYEVNGNPLSKHKGFLSMRFPAYNLTVEYYRAPFLVVIGRPPPNSSEQIRMTIRVDEFNWQSKKWVGANVLIFNTGHWWNEDKTVKMGYYFQEKGKVNMSMNVMEAFHKSLLTWKSWMINKLDLEKTRIFFRGYSPVHYRNGTWNLGGSCDADMEPETNYRKLEPEPLNNIYISEVVKQMGHENWNVQFLNITYLTEFRKDSHPSMYREPGTPADAPQDCSHWCLPGVPDTWNDILYAQLLEMEN